MRSVVDLPQPDGPEQDHELAVADMEVDVLHRLDVGGIDLADVVRA